MLGYKVLSSCTSTYAFNSFLLPPAPDVLSWGGVEWGRHGGALGCSFGPRVGV
ncbi:Nphs1: Nephrin [Crotalus adamanteus]|uniref:Nphs1: Nephrin n=1 Tax=Crotalus adamanteus TaxID=8729 RepID=A0AAW1BL94_CROAD